MYAKNSQEQSKKDFRSTKKKKAKIYDEQHSLRYQCKQLDEKEFYQLEQLKHSCQKMHQQNKVNKSKEIYNSKSHSITVARYNHFIYLLLRYTLFGTQNNNNFDLDRIRKTLEIYKKLFVPLGNNLNLVIEAKSDITTTLFNNSPYQTKIRYLQAQIYQQSYKNLQRYFTNVFNYDQKLKQISITDKQASVYINPLYQILEQMAKKVYVFKKDLSPQLFTNKYRMSFNEMYFVAKITEYLIESQYYKQRKKSLQKIKNSHKIKQTKELQLSTKQQQSVKQSIGQINTQIVDNVPEERFTKRPPPKASKLLLKYDNYKKLKATQQITSSIPQQQSQQQILDKINHHLKLDSSKLAKNAQTEKYLQKYTTLNRCQEINKQAEQYYNYQRINKLNMKKVIDRLLSEYNKEGEFNFLTESIESHE